MTKEEREKAIRKLTEIKNNYERSLNLNTDFSKDDSEDELYALELAIRALEQEPCEDAVSRKEVEFMLTGGKYSEEDYEQFIDRLFEKLKSLPSVTPTREHGEWIQEEYWSEGCGMGESYGHWYRCSKCGNRVKDGYKKCGLNFCSKCGTDMRGTKLPYTDKSGLEYADQPTLRSAT